MPVEYLNLKIVIILTVGFVFASLLGYISYRAKFSSILGYLIAGYLIGPYSPGFVADRQVAEQLAEIGVILMMFGVGLHFQWKNLLSVSRIAIPGAIGQTLVTTVIGAAAMHFYGWSWEAGIIFGLAIGVASTVVLVRMLSDHNLLNTSQGHIAVGWLIVEDIITVGALLLISTLAASVQGEGLPFSQLLFAFVLVIVKFLILTFFMFTIGLRIVTYILYKFMQTNSHELMTLATLAITFFISTGSALLFGTSIALGAFLAGMVIGQTNMRHKISSNATPLKDTFVVIFFLSVGMLFDPAVIGEHFFLFLAILGIILLVKPVTAFLIAYCYKYPYKTGLTIAIALAQIGEFSFILCEESMKFNILPRMGYDIIVACSLVSISINPLLFRLLRDKRVMSNEASSDE